jgi:hypothetical protein
MLNFLLSKSADVTLTVAGFIWGKGYEWETLMPAVNPISYAMMGLLPQVHRSEHTISNVVFILLKAAYGIQYTPGEYSECLFKEVASGFNKIRSGQPVIRGRYQMQY